MLDDLFSYSKLHYILKVITTDLIVNTIIKTEAFKKYNTEKQSLTVCLPFQNGEI